MRRILKIVLISIVSISISGCSEYQIDNSSYDPTVYKTIETDAVITDIESTRWMSFIRTDVEVHNEEYNLDYFSDFSGMDGYVMRDHSVGDIVRIRITEQVKEKSGKVVSRYITYVYSE